MSRFTSRALEILAAGTMLAAACLAFAPKTAAAEYENGIELSLGASYYSNDDDSNLDFSSWGARYHHDFNARWGFEVAYTRQDQDSLEADVIEASARFSFFENDRIRVFAEWGAGVVSYDYARIVGGDAVIYGSDDAAIYHAGIGAEIDLNERFYLRPDFRQRWAVDFFSPYDDSTSEATLAAGVRF